MTKTQRRRVTYKMYPSPTQVKELDRICYLHRKLYNGALEERISSYDKNKVGIYYNDQCKSVTEIRKCDPEYRSLNAQSLQVTLKRLDLAYKAFFRRVKEKEEEPGFPRFKSRNRFKGFGFTTHNSGFKFTPDHNWEHGKLHLSGVGTIRVRGRARTHGKVVCCSITRKSDDWYLSLVLECDPFVKRFA